MLVTFSLTILILVTTTLPMTMTLGQQEQNWLTYNSSGIGYSIKHPSDWDDTGGEDTTLHANTSSLIFASPKNALFGIDVESVQKYLDTDALTLKTKTLQNYTTEFIAGIKSEPDSEFVKNISTTIGQNHYPASQIHYWGDSKKEYRITTLMVNDGYDYFFGFEAPPLDVPEVFPTVEKMLASFQITK